MNDEKGRSLRPKIPNTKIREIVEKAELGAAKARKEKGHRSLPKLGGVRGDSELLIKDEYRRSFRIDVLNYFDASRDFTNDDLKLCNHHIQKRKENLKANAGIIREISCAVKQITGSLPTTLKDERGDWIKPELVRVRDAVRTYGDAHFSEIEAGIRIMYADMPISITEDEWKIQTDQLHKYRGAWQLLFERAVSLKVAFPDREIPITDEEISSALAYAMDRHRARDRGEGLHESTLLLANIKILFPDRKVLPIWEGWEKRNTMYSDIRKRLHSKKEVTTGELLSFLKFTSALAILSEQSDVYGKRLDQRKKPVDARLKKIVDDAELRAAEERKWKGQVALEGDEELLKAAEPTEANKTAPLTLVSGSEGSLPLSDISPFDAASEFTPGDFKRFNDVLDNLRTESVSRLYFRWIASNLKIITDKRPPAFTDEEIEKLLSARDYAREKRSGDFTDKEACLRIMREGRPLVLSDDEWSTILLQWPVRPSVVEFCDRALNMHIAFPNRNTPFKSEDMARILDAQQTYAFSISGDEVVSFARISAALKVFAPDKMHKITAQNWATMRAEYGRRRDQIMIAAEPSHTEILEFLRLTSAMRILAAKEVEATDSGLKFTEYKF